jgi:hypothetical protein
VVEVGLPLLHFNVKRGEVLAATGLKHEERGIDRVLYGYTTGWKFTHCTCHRYRYLKTCN